MTGRHLPAAAVRVGTVLRLPTGDITVAHVRNATPVAGRLTITDTSGHTWVFGGAERVTVVSLP